MPCLSFPWQPQERWQVLPVWGAAVSLWLVTAAVLSRQGISPQGGSAGKGTALQNNSDADVVLFLDCFSGYQEQKEKRKHILDLIERRLHACKRSLTFTVDISEPRYKGPGNTPRSLSLTLRSKRTLESIEVDILPAYDALGKGCELVQGWAEVSVLGWLSPSFLPHRATETG